MRGRTVILFLIALLLAGGTAALVRSWLAQRPTIAAAPPPPRVTEKSILVAGVTITRGQILTRLRGLGPFFVFGPLNINGLG